jgi:hypothetical protein
VLVNLYYPVENLVKIEVALCLAIIFRLKINVSKAFPTSPTKKKLKTTALRNEKLKMGKAIYFSS